MIAFIDNKDSFSFNIVQALERVSGDQVRVFRSEECTVAEVEAGAGNLSGTSGDWRCFWC